jgi:hypothetical protein
MFLVELYIDMSRRGQAAMDVQASAIHDWSPATFVTARYQPGARERSIVSRFLSMA